MLKGQGFGSCLQQFAQTRPWTDHPLPTHIWLFLLLAQFSLFSTVHNHPYAQISQFLRPLSHGHFETWSNPVSHIGGVECWSLNWVEPGLRNPVVEVVSIRLQTGLEVLENGGIWASHSQSSFSLPHRVSLAAKLSMKAKIGTSYTGLTYTWSDRVGSRDRLVVWSIQQGEHPSAACRCYLQVVLFRNVKEICRPRCCDQGEQVLLSLAKGHHSSSRSQILSSCCISSLSASLSKPN